MGEPKSVRPVMLPPEGFTAHAVARGLAEVIAAEALRDLTLHRRAQNRDADPADPRCDRHRIGAPHRAIDIDVEPHNDVAPPRLRRRCDSGIIAGLNIDDTPTLPFIRTAHADD
jgi:hypothetical protein